MAGAMVAHEGSLRPSQLLYILDECNNACIAGIASESATVGLSLGRLSHIQAMAGVGTAEWWVHTRGSSDPHQLHYDMDERFLGQGRAGYQLHHPVSTAQSNCDNTLVMVAGSKTGLAGMSVNLPCPCT